MQRKNFYQMSIDQVLEELKTTKKGLTKNDIKERLAYSKSCMIKGEEKQSFFIKFLNQIKELMVLILLISGITSIVIGVIGNSNSEIIDGVIILGIVVMNAFFGVYQERKSEKAIESLKKLTLPETLVLREGKVEKIKTEDLVLGDVVCLESGSIVPADLRLCNSNDFKVNESSLTGESEAIDKNCDFVYEKDIPIAEQKNMVFSGSVVENGHAYGIVTALGKETELGKIAESIKETKKDLTPLQKSIQGVGKILTYLILLIASITFILEVVENPKEILQAFLTAIAISVAAIPESMPAVITIIMSLGMARLSKQKAIVKRMHAVETLGACDIICSDKTGTITQNKMNVEKIFTFINQNDKEMITFIESMAICNDAQFGKNGFIGSSTEVALLNYAAKNGVQKKDVEILYPRIDEISFNSKTKIMMTLNFYQNKNTCFMKGALDRILKYCKYYMKDGQVFPLDSSIKNIIMKQNQKFCEDALRVIGFAYKISDELDEKDYIFMGFCGIQDPPRKEIKSAVETCRAAGMRPIMITGDYKDTAFAIAKKVGIANKMSQVISGEELDRIDSFEKFSETVKEKNVFARVSPEHKAKIVEILQKNGHIVAMTGDGVNDAPSLKKADIGIGMGKSGTDVTKDVADIIITDDNFATIVIAVEEGRKIYSNIQKTIKYLFSANMAEILALFFITILFPGKTFLLPVQILFVNLITDSIPAVAIGTEPAENDIMMERPRNKKQGLFSNGVGVSILVLGFMQTILTMTAYITGLFLYNEEIAMTMAFYTLNFIQLFYMFTARTKRFCLKSNPLKNKLFLLSMIVGFGLLFIIAFTRFGEVLKLQALNPFCWTVVLVLSISIIFIGELYKYIENKHIYKNCINK